MFLDLLSAADIVAGSLEHYFTKGAHEADVEISEHANKVLKWLANEGVGLKKQNIIIRTNDEGSIVTGTLEINLKEPDTDGITIPVFRP